MNKELTIVEIADLKKVHRSTVLRWIKSKFFPNARLVKSPASDYWLVPENEVNDFEAPLPGPKKKIKKETAAA